MAGRGFPFSAPYFVYYFRALGFSGSSSEAVHYTITLLSNLVFYDKATGVISTPLQELPSALELFHHANQVSTMFIRESIIG